MLNLTRLKIVSVHLQLCLNQIQLPTAATATTAITATAATATTATTATAATAATALSTARCKI